MYLVDNVVGCESYQFVVFPAALDKSRLRLLATAASAELQKFHFLLEFPNFPRTPTFFQNTELDFQLDLSLATITTRMIL